MKLNPINWLLDDDRNKSLPVLLAVTPPRTGERTLLGVENLLGSIAVPEPFSLELAGDMDGVTLMARCLDKEAVRGQISAHYPQALIREVPREEDPLRLEEGERAWSMTLRADGPEYAPLRTFRDDDLLDPGSDPLIALLGALSALKEGERVVARLLLRSLGPDWSQAHMEKAHKRPGMEPMEPAYTYQTKPLQTDGITMAVLGVAALAALKGYLWVQAGETWKAALLGTGIALGLAVGGFAWHRWKKARSRVYDPILIKEKVSRIAFDAELQVTAVLPPEAGPKRAKELLDPVAVAYRHYDNPAGARLKAGTARPALPTANLHPAGPGLFGKRSVLGVREVAALWHPPGAGDETPLVERSGPGCCSPRRGESGAERTWGRPPPGNAGTSISPTTCSGVTTSTWPAPRMGKSTLMHHIVVHKMKEKAEGRGPGRHRRDRPPRRPGGRAASARPRVPRRPGAAHRPGRRAGSSRDQPPRHEGVRRPRPHRRLGGARGAGPVGAVGSQDAVHPGADRQDPPRGQRADGRRGAAHHPGRAQAALRQEVPRRRAEEGLRPLPAGVVGQGLRQMAQPVQGRGAGPRPDPALLLRILQAGQGHPGTAPLHHRPAQHHPGRRSAAGLHVPGDGGPGRGRPGGRVFAEPRRFGHTEQGSMPLEKRRGALVVVDEMQSMPGLDYESMLSELGKFGASFVLATQSLAKLGDLSPTMQDTLLANIGCLAVFQVAGSDARTLVWELGKDRVSEDDITSLPCITAT